MAYNLEKKLSSDARKAANTAFGLGCAFIGLALGARPSTRRSRPSIKPRRRRIWQVLGLKYK